nr:NRDE family protein [Sinobaca sp. H24]
MCLLTMSYNMRSDYPLIIAANRDEFFERPTEPLHIWENSPIIAGKDVKLGGTWMGVTKPVGLLLLRM